MRSSPSGRIAAAESPIPLHPSRPPPNPPPITYNLLIKYMIMPLSKLEATVIWEMRDKSFLTTRDEMLSEGILKNQVFCGHRGFDESQPYYDQPVLHVNRFQCSS